MAQNFEIKRFANIQNYKSNIIQQQENLSYLDQISQLKNMNYPNLNPDNIATQDSEKMVQAQLYQSRSKNMIYQCQNISFQKGYMFEHCQSALVQFQSYIETQQTLLSPIIPDFQSKQFLSTSQSMVPQYLTVKQLLKQQQIFLMTQQQIQRLIIDLRREDKLNQFLEFIIRRVDGKVARECIYIANKMWEQYIKIQDHNYNYKQTIQYTENVVNSFTHDADLILQQINFADSKIFISHDQNKQRKKNLQRFLNYLMTTFSLVLGGFFENIFTKEHSNYHKRNIQEKEVSNLQDKYGSDDQQEGEQGNFGNKSKKIKN